MNRIAALFPLALLGACTHPYVEPPPDPDYPYTPHVSLGRHAVSVIETRRVVPGPGLPDAAPAQTSNNNLDVIRHGGRTYLAWRTGPSHYASPEVRMHVVSSDDELTWTHETTIALDTDVREPRFLEVGGRLFFYVSRLGTNSAGFRPQGVSYTERLASGEWTSVSEIFDPGFLLWRTRVLDGTAYAIGYYNGARIYDLTAPPVQIALYTTTDGTTFVPVDPERRDVLVGGGSEADFAFDGRGDLYAVVRNEAGDEEGFGSFVCRAPADDLAAWDCARDPRKYDSPNVFAHDGEIYLLGRRHVTPSGHFDLMLDEPYPRQYIENQLAYRNAPKRCSLWRVDRASLSVRFVLDLPSRGDTCFASVLPGNTPDELVVYDYSSDIEGEDVPWRVGQEGPTYVYRHVLAFERR